MNMKHTMRWIGIIITSIALIACGGGGSDPVVKTEKVWRLVEEFSGPTVKKTYEYDGSGRLIKQINYYGDYYEFNYDDKGRLISRDDFKSTGVLRSHYKFDSHGGMISDSTFNASGAIVSTTTFINTYDDSRVVSDKAIKRPYGSNTYTVYPSSKLVTREMVRPAFFARYTYEGYNKVATKVFGTSTDTVPNVKVEEEYNEQGDRVRRLLDTDGDGPKPPSIFLDDYTYILDENGNISKRVQALSGGATSTTTYIWEPMDIPVQ